MERALSLYRDSIVIRAKTEDVKTKVSHIRRQQQMEASAQILKYSGKPLSALPRSRSDEDKENKETSETFRKAFAEWRSSQCQLELNSLLFESCTPRPTPHCHSPIDEVYPQDCNPEEPHTLPPIAFCSRTQGCVGDGKGTDCNQNDLEVPTGEEEVRSSGCGQSHSVTVMSNNWTFVTPLTRCSRRIFWSPLESSSEEKKDESGDTSLWSETSTVSTVVAASIPTSTRGCKSISAKYSENETLLWPIGPTHKPQTLISKSSAPALVEYEEDSANYDSGDGACGKESSVFSGAGSLNSLSDLSNISRESELNRREEISTVGNFNGAFHSTFNYPLHSTMHHQCTNFLDISPVPSSSVAVPPRLTTVASPRSKNTRVSTGQVLSVDGDPRELGCRCAVTHQIQDLDRQRFSLNNPVQILPLKRQMMDNLSSNESVRPYNDIALTFRKPSENVKRTASPLHSKQCVDSFKRKKTSHVTSLRRQTGQVELTTSSSISDSAGCRQIGLLGRCRFQLLKPTGRLEDAASTVAQTKPSIPSSETASCNTNVYKSGDLMSTDVDEVATLIDPLRCSGPQDSARPTTMNNAGMRKKTARHRMDNTCLPSLLAFVPCKSVKRFVGSTVSTTPRNQTGGMMTLDNVAAWLCAGTKGAAAADTTTLTSPAGQKRQRFDLPQNSADDKFPPTHPNNSNYQLSAGGFKTEDIARFSTHGNINKSCTVVTSGSQQRQKNFCCKKKQENAMRGRRLRRSRSVSRLQRSDLTNVRRKVRRHAEESTQSDDNTVCIRTLGFL